ncbi:MAG TPA: 50S ribosomal protein L24 [Clostridiales bacterium]|jgi:large subunit ribosomal protein L24|nr:50S ribosomal protein L24 [Clostridiales bacterium]
MNTLHVKTGDTVIVLSGKDKGKTGKVLSADPKKATVIVENVNIVTKHQKARKQGEESKIVKKEGNIRACKVMRVCPECKKPTRLAHKIEGDVKVRVCKHCHKAI